MTDTNPLTRVAEWVEHAREQGFAEPTAATLATADLAGRPSARVVLVRRIGSDGLEFFTNYESRKARELEGNSRAALVFWWDRLERQIRVVGSVERSPASVSDEYFAGRARGSQLGAWASAQSRPIGSRAELEERLEQVRERFGEGVVPRPPFWGGYRLQPDEVEFWSGRPDRLHDRIVYRLSDGLWSRIQLSP